MGNTSYFFEPVSDFILILWVQNEKKSYIVSIHKFESAKWSVQNHR